MLGFLSALKKADYGFFQNDFGNKSEIIKKYKYGHPPIYIYYLIRLENHLKISPEHLKWKYRCIDIAD